jgi:polyphosphate kinase 2 (PPK2 family)
MSLQDVEERTHWEAYMEAYQEMLTKTSTEESPWYVIPGNDKKNARLIISRIILEEMQGLDMHFPEMTDGFRHRLQEVKDFLKDN